MKNLYTDLAIEVARDSGSGGVKIEKEKHKNGIIKEIVEVVTDSASRLLGKPKGRYITVDSENIAMAKNIQIETAEILADAIRNLISSKGKHLNVLVCGIGNRMFTADALGPKVTDSVIVTRHLLQLDNGESGVLPEKIKHSVSIIAPGVLGSNGIETYDIVSGVAKAVKPDYIILVDSLASRKVKRLACSFQVTNTGLLPGGALDGKRKLLSEETLGVPVIAIGVPLVVHIGSLVYDTVSEIFKLSGLNENDSASEKIIRKIKSNINASVANGTGALVVTPKDIDAVLDTCVFVVSLAINLALHEGLSVEDVLALSS